MFDNFNINYIIFRNVKVFKNYILTYTHYMVEFHCRFVVGYFL